MLFNYPLSESHLPAVEGDYKDYTEKKNKKKAMSTMRSKALPCQTGRQAGVILTSYDFVNARGRKFVKNLYNVETEISLKITTR